MSNGKVPGTIKPTNGIKVSIKDTPYERGWFWPDEARDRLSELYRQHGYVMFTSCKELAVGDVVNAESFGDASRQTITGLVLRVIGKSSDEELKRYWNMPPGMQPDHDDFPFVYRAEILD